VRTLRVGILSSDRNKHRLGRDGTRDSNLAESRRIYQIYSSAYMYSVVPSCDTIDFAKEIEGFRGATQASKLVQVSTGSAPGRGTDSPASPRACLPYAAGSRRSSAFGDLRDPPRAAELHGRNSVGKAPFSHRSGLPRMDGAMCLSRFGVAATVVRLAEFEPLAMSLAGQDDVGASRNGLHSTHHRSRSS
jgi:hypothetical protein